MSDDVRELIGLAERPGPLPGTVEERLWESTRAVFDGAIARAGNGDGSGDVLVVVQPGRSGGAPGARRRMLFGLVAAASVALVTAAIAFVFGEGDRVEFEPPATSETSSAPTTFAPETTIAPATETAPDTADAPESTNVPTEASAAPVGTEAPTAEVTLLDFEGSSLGVVWLEPGTYLVPTLGTPITMMLPDGFGVMPNRDGRTVLFGDPMRPEPGGNELVLHRPRQFIDPTNPRVPAAERGEWPIDDVRGWIDALIPEIVVSDVRELTISGFDAVRFDVDVSDELGCLSTVCIEYATNGLTGSFLGPEPSWRVWWISQGELDPILVTVGASRDRDEFLAIATEVVESMEIGEPVPNPVGP